MLQSSSGALIPSLNTLSDRTPVIGNGSYYSSNSLELAGYWANFAALYKSQLWVRTVVTKLAKGQARLPFGARIEDDKGNFTPEVGALSQLLQRPNHRMSGFQMKRWISSTKDVYGEAFLVKLRDTKDRPRELWPMHPSNVTVRVLANGELEYVYTAGRLSGAAEGLPTFAERDVIVFSDYNPDNMTRGLSPLEALRMTLLNEDASRRATANFWKRGARPGVVLQHPKELSEGAQTRLKKQFDASVAGADNMGGSAILEEGMTANIIQLNLEEMQYIESRKLNREEVCAVYDVAPPAVHILDHATFSNITEQLRGFYRDTMTPRNEEVESVFDHQLVPDFYPDGDVTTFFNMDEVLRGDFETRATAVSGLVQNGVFTPAEGRKMFNLPPKGAEADVLYANAALVPLGSNSGNHQVAEDGTLIPRALPALAAPKALPTLRQIMGRLSQAKAAGTKALRAKLVDEHAKELAAFFDRQKASVLSKVTQKAAGVFEPTDWDDELAGILSTLSTATTKAIGTATASALGGKYDGGQIADWLQTDAKDSATNLNATTAALIQARIATGDETDDGDELNPADEMSDLFDGEISARAGEISISRVSMLAGFAALVAAEQSGAKTKTWNVTAANPRPSHASMDGETVGLGETFSNGMNGPGDFSGGADEVAGCTCELSFQLEE